MEREEGQENSESGSDRGPNDTDTVPIRNGVRERIDKEYWNNFDSGLSIHRLKQSTRGPNNFIREQHRYNADTYDPLDDSEYSSLASFIASDEHADETSTQGSDSDETTINEDSDADVVTLEDSGLVENINEVSNNGNDTEDIPQFRNARKAAAVISSDEDEDDAPTSRRRLVNLSQSSTDSSQSPIYLKRRATSLGDDTAPPNAPKKRRLSERVRDDSNETPRRSSRIAQSTARQEKTRRRLFDQYRQDRKEFLTRLAARSFVERPEIVEEDEEVHAEPTEKCAGFIAIASLSEMPNGSIVSVRGKVVQYGDSDTRPESMTSLRRVEIRQIVLQDQTGTVDITLWRQYACNENVELGAFLELHGLKKYNYKDRPTLGTYLRCVIEPFVPSPSYVDSLTPLHGSDSTYTITEIIPWKTYVYEACARCYFTKTEPADDGKLVCRKCKTCYSVEDTQIGIAMRIVVKEQAKEEEEIATIFTKSVRKIAPTIPIHWDDQLGSRDEIKDVIVHAVESVLPIVVCCKDTTAGCLTVNAVRREGM